jgi:hypothetical protein
MAYSYSDPDVAADSFGLLVEWVLDHTTLSEEQAEKIARALLSFADVLVD